MFKMIDKDVSQLMGWMTEVNLSLHLALLRPQTGIEKIPHDHQEAFSNSDQVLAEVAHKRDESSTLVTSKSYLDMVQSTHWAWRS